MMRDIIKYTLQIVISVLIAMEVSIPPNDYVRHLIVVLILYICFKNKVDERILACEIEIDILNDPDRKSVV